MKLPNYNILDSNIFSLNPNYLGLYGVVFCLLGTFFPLLILLTSDNWDEMFSNLPIVLILIFLQIVGFFFGFLSKQTRQGLFSLIFSTIMSISLISLAIVAREKFDSRIILPKPNQSQAAPLPAKSSGLVPAKVQNQRSAFPPRTVPAMSKDERLEMKRKMGHRK
jgi:hypothetical protein